MSRARRAKSAISKRVHWNGSSSIGNPRSDSNAGAPDIAQLLAVRVVRERDHHVRSRAQELAVQLADRLRLVEDHLGHIGAGLDVAAPLQLEDVALGADDDALSEPLFQGPLRRTAMRRAPLVE